MVYVNDNYMHQNSFFNNIQTNCSFWTSNASRRLSLEKQYSIEKLANDYGNLNRNIK